MTVTSSLLVAALVGLVAWNLVRTDRALARSRDLRCTYWQDPRTVWWGLVEPRGGGFVVRFDAPYAPHGEPRRSAAVVDPRLAQSSIALVRPHDTRERFAELERRELARRQGRGDGGEWWEEAVALVRSAFDAATDAVARVLDPRVERPCQDGSVLERARGGWVVIELACGAQVRGLLVEIGRSYLAVVTPPHDEVRQWRVAAGATDDTVPLRASAHGDTLSIRARDVPVEVESVTTDTRTWSLGVVVLPGTELVLPLAGAERAVVHGSSGAGLDVVAPRARTQVRFLSDGDGPTDTGARDGATTT